uniref:(northern house mosquito) hypothetical protein n=1 Tax=Culex pipiens TaxID=7175 RepID=A0A8D8KY72_CULPI
MAQQKVTQKELQLSLLLHVLALFNVTDPAVGTFIVFVNVLLNLLVKAILIFRWFPLRISRMLRAKVLPELPLAVARLEVGAPGFRLHRAENSILTHLNVFDLVGDHRSVTRKQYVFQIGMFQPEMRQKSLFIVAVLSVLAITFRLNGTTDPSIGIDLRETSLHDVELFRFNARVRTLLVVAFVRGRTFLRKSLLLRLARMGRAEVSQKVVLA